METNSATITDLNTANGKITNLTSNVATIQTLVNGNITSANMAAGAIQAGDATIANGAISSAQIISLDVSKLNAGNISTNKFVVTSDSGNLKIQGNTLHVWDNNGKERISLGLNGTDYNLLVRGSDGNTVLFGTDGVTHAGITDGAVDDSKVAENANISGSKIEKESLVTQINGANTTLKSSKIKFDDTGQTLDVAFSSLSSTVSGLSSTVSSQGTSISAIQGAITSKVWQTDITGAVNNIQVGGRNLIRNSVVYNDTSMWNMKTFGTRDTNITFNGNNSIKIKTASNGFDGIVSTGYTIPFKANTNYTMSVYAYRNSASSDGNLTKTFRLYLSEYKNGSIVSYRELDIDNSKLPDKTWTKFIFTFKTNSDSDSFGHFQGDFINISGTSCIWITEIKLEEGNKATDCSPAPEDFQGQITTINSNYSTLSQTVNGISSTVGSLQTSLDSTNGNVTSVTNRVSTVEQTVNGFSSTLSSVQTDVNKKAYSTDVTNSINTAIDGISIGGRNLIRKSRIYGTKTTDVYGGNNGYYNDISTTQWRISNWTIHDVDTYSLSFWVKASNPGNIEIDLCDIHNYVISITTDWQYFKLENIYVNSVHLNNSYYGFIDFNGGLVGTLYLCFVKLEKGTKCTMYTDAPEDTQSQIDTANSNITSIQTTVSSHTSSISALQSSISLKLDTNTFSNYQTTVDGEISSINSTLSTQSSSITLLQNSITSKVTQTDIDTSIDNINIGGTNLVPHSELIDSFSNSIVDDSGNVQASYVDGVGYNGKSSLMLHRTQGSPSNFQINKAFKVNQLAGNSVTMSIKYKPVNAGEIPVFNMGFWFYYNGKYINNLPINTKDVSNGWKLAWVIFNFPPNATDDHGSLGGASGINTLGSVDTYFNDFKVELGNKATAWSPAPEDVISQAQAYTDGQISTVNSAISTHTSEIAQLNNDISLKVSTSDYKGNTISSLINQTATTVQIDASKINLNGYVTISSLQAGGSTTIDGGQITTGYIDSNRIQANSISTDKLLIGDFTNLVDNPSFETGTLAGWNASALWQIDTTNPHSGTYKALFSNANGDTQTLFTQNSISVNAGDQFYVSAWIDVDGGFSPNTNNPVNLCLYDVDSGNVVAANAPYYNGNGSWAQISTTLTVPSGTTRVKLRIASYMTSSDTSVRIDDIEFRRINGTTLIANGAITTDKIVSQAITADKIAAHTITANEIASNTITAAQMAAGTITASSGIISSIDASKITTGTLSGDRIYGGTITGALLKTSNTSNYMYLHDQYIDFYKSGSKMATIGYDQSSDSQYLYPKLSLFDTSGGEHAVGMYRDGKLWSNINYFPLGVTFNSGLDSTSNITTNGLTSYDDISAMYNIEAINGTITAGSGFSGLGRRAAYSESVSISTGSSEYIYHYLGYYPIVVLSGTIGNVIVTYVHQSSSCLRVYCYSGGGATWNGVVYLY